MAVLVLFWAFWVGVCLGATVAAVSQGERVGAILSGLCLLVAIALGLYCYRGLDQ